MRSYAQTDIGIVRQMNQDFVFADDTPVGPLANLYIVADGMGGHKAGDFASRFCVEKFTELIRAAGPEQYSIINLIEESLRQTNEQLMFKAAESADYEGMGTTFVGCTINADGIMIAANIGDSRLYLARKELIQITEDHSLVAEMVRKGDIKKEEARFHPKKNVVTRAISAAGVAIPDFFEVQLRPGDIVLLCSDGLSNMLSDADIFEIIDAHRNSLQDMGICLIQRANDNGGKDNISVVLAEYSPETAPEPGAEQTADTQ